jgi:uroporphyrinogen decarboxylase
MNITPDWNRVVNTIRCQPTDRVPLSEVLIAYEIQGKFLGRPVGPDDLAAQVEFWSSAGYDYIPLNIGMMEPGKVTENSPISKVLKKLHESDDPNSSQGDDKNWNLEVASFIHNERDFEAFPWAELADLDFSKLSGASALLPPGMKAIGVSGKIFTLTWMLMGFNNFAMAVIKDTPLLRAIFEKVAQIQLSALDTILAMPHVGGIWVVDDLAYNSGPIISLKHLEKFVFPWYKEIARRCHLADKLFFLHSDGKLDALIPSFIDIGLDVIQPVDPTCNDIVKIKEHVAGKLCIVGNVPNDMLQDGKPEDIQKYVRTLLAKVAPGGGFMLGSGNSVPDWAKFENYQALRETALAEGIYQAK